MFSYPWIGARFVFSKRFRFIVQILFDEGIKTSARIPLPLGPDMTDEAECNVALSGKLVGREQVSELIFNIGKLKDKRVVARQMKNPLPEWQEYASLDYICVCGRGFRNLQGAENSGDKDDGP